MDTDQQATLQAAINSLMDDSPLDKVVGCASSYGLDGSTVPLRIALLHLRFKEDSPQEDALARFLWQQCFNYALSRRRRIEFQQRISASPGDLTAAAELTERVRNIFLTFRAAYPHRASELGEVLAYAIAIRHLNAAQMAAKMSLKTSPNMPVHGLDGIHAVYENQALTIYFLESKVTKTANAGVKDYAESVSLFTNNQKQYLREYELVGDLGNLDSLEGEARELALKHFDLFNEPHLARRERSVGVICYSEKKHFSTTVDIDDSQPNIHEENFVGLYSQDIDKLTASSLKHLSKYSTNPKKCILFFVAVPDVDKLREKFYAMMGLPDLPALPLVTATVTECEAEDE